MVISQRNADSNVVILLPNRSATWEETRLFLYVICGTALAVGVFWAVIGVWAILPFTGLEILLLVFVMYRVCHATYQRQVITCSPASVLVQFGSWFPKRSWTLDRTATHLAVTAGAHHLDGPTLRITDAEHSIEVGKFLNREDRELAVQALRDAGLYRRTRESDASAGF